jgi:hypothetical protein
VNHLLVGFAICAALSIYPGGLTVLVAALAGSAGPVLVRPGARWRREEFWNRLSRNSAATLLGVALAGLVLAPMPWPGNPVAPLGVSWASGSDLGGLALTLSGLWALHLVGSARAHEGRVLALLGAWSLGLILLAMAVHAATWSGVLTAGGLGAEVGRVLLAVAWLGLMPWALADAPGGAAVRDCAAVAGTGVALFLMLPQIQATPTLVVLPAWWALLLALGLACAAARRWGIGTLRRTGLPFPDARLD